jgi:hypothetical protein
MSDSSVCRSPFLRLSEAAAFLRLDPRTLDNMRQRGTGPLYSKHGSRVVYHRDDLVGWSNEHRRRTTTEMKPRPPNEREPLAPPEASQNERAVDY